MIRSIMLIVTFFVLWVPTLSQTEYLFTRLMTMVGAFAICFVLNWLTSPELRD
jgi:hypothetical protein